jgi:hypothetical protein
MAYLTEAKSESTAINSNDKQKTRRNISSMTGTVRKVGHGAHMVLILSIKAGLCWFVCGSYSKR